jgi:protein-disulfide isomerase
MGMKMGNVLGAALIALSASVCLPVSANALDDAQKKEMGDFIKEYLIANPEIMLDVQRALETKQAEAQNAKAAAAVTANKDAIFASADDVVLGNPKGNVTIVEFFDYNCGYCKRALPDMTNIISNDPDVRFVLKEFPILGPDSVAAHKVAAALKTLAPEKYRDFHLAMLGSKDHATEASAIAVAETLGVKEADLRAEMKARPNDEAVQKVYQLANSLGVTGTPSYVVGNEAVFGAIGESALTGKIANVRACGKTIC